MKSAGAQRRKDHRGVSVRRLLVHVEGDTEELFVNELLASHLYEHGYDEVSARKIGNARQRQKRSGIPAWESARTGIVRHLKGDKSCLVTTMVDYYGLPQSGSRKWPGRTQISRTMQAHQKARYIENEIMKDLQKVMPADFDQRRFIPFVMMHEFEALLFSDCRRFANGIGHKELAKDFQVIRDAFPTPEDIDDSPRTAPSKRIRDFCPQYEKSLMGPLASLEIGIEAMCRECPHFADWLQRLKKAQAT